MRSKMLCVIIPLVFLGFFGAVGSIEAEIFKWTDEKGTVHLTDDPATIPERYRDKAESRATEEDKMSIEEKLKVRQWEEADRERRLRSEEEKYRLMEQEERSKKIQRESSQPNDTPTMPSPGYIPHDKFIHLTEGMTEAEVLSRFGSPTREVQDEAKTKGNIHGYVDPGGSMTGTMKGKTIVIKRYYYIGDRTKGEKTTIIHFENGKVVKYERI